MTLMDFDKTIIFTDGACSGNPGRGGWGAIIIFKDGKVVEKGAGNKSTTNNQMELAATIHGLKTASQSTDKITLYTDSTYVIRGITQWIWGWIKRGWTNAEGNEVSNKILWQELHRVTQSIGPKNIEWKYVRGHTGVPGNERCDEIAVGFTKGKWVELYEGSLLQYDVAVMDLPPDVPLPEIRNKNTSKPKAFSYLSYVDGQLERHETWSECEARVKGRSGAKFKKATSKADEAKVIESWGLDPDSI